MKANNTIETRVKCYGDSEMNAKIYELKKNGFNRVENAYWVEHWQKGNELIILERCDESERPTTPETPNPENNTPATMNANETELTAEQAAYYNAMLTPSDESASLAWESEPKTDEELTALGVDAFGDNENANETTVTVHHVAPGHWQASANGVKFGWVCTWDHGTFAACMNIGIREQKAFASLDLWNEQRGTYGHKTESAAVASLSEMITSYFAKYGYTAKVLNA